MAIGCAAAVSDLDSREEPDSLEESITLWIIGVVLGWDLEHCRHCLVVLVNCRPDSIGNVLRDEDDGNVVSRREGLECCFYLLQCCLYSCMQRVGS